NAVEIGAQVVLPFVSSISEEMVVDAHDLGLEVVAWTVNEEKDLNKLKGWGVDGVITDHYLDMKNML
ncbi:MAG TPA: glycerophosphodiester phosphodiesterase family protein, partial [Candidatus Anoxymicrobiaceae bacterium]